MQSAEMKITSKTNISIARLHLYSPLLRINLLNINHPFFKIEYLEKKDLHLL